MCLANKLPTNDVAPFDNGAADRDTLSGHYARIKAEATRLAGEPGDIAQRAAVHHSLFLDSGGNHTFPQIALHGALWAAGFFETSGKLGRIIQYRYCYDKRERAYRMGLLNTFAEGFKVVNRAVFIDTYTNDHFTRHYGQQAGCEQLLHPSLLAALNTLHAARADGNNLSEAQKKHLFLQALQWEQEVTVGPGVQAEVARFPCPILTALCLRPVVHFAYFPTGKYLFFRNFADTQERIANATRSYDLAARCGWAQVVATMRDYRVLPETFFNDPLSYVRQLQQRASYVSPANSAPRKP